MALDEFVNRGAPPPPRRFRVFNCPQVMPLWTVSERLSRGQPIGQGCSGPISLRRLRRSRQVPMLNREVLLDDGVLTQTVDGALGSDFSLFRYVTVARY